MTLLAPALYDTARKGQSAIEQEAQPEAGHVYYVRVDMPGVGCLTNRICVWRASDIHLVLSLLNLNS